jgi:hypothetical protein
MCRHMNMLVTIVTSRSVVLWLATASTKLRGGLTGEIPLSATTKHGTTTAAIGESDWRLIGALRRLRSRERRH